jgi:hypothetical protein
MLRKFFCGVNRLFSRTTKTNGESQRKRLVLLKCIAGEELVSHGSEGVQVLIVNIPKVAPENQGLLDQLIDEALPQQWRQLNDPRTIKATGRVERLTAADLLARVADIRLFDALAISRPDSERVTGQQAVQTALGVAR